jgi:hypothetical protein
VLICKKAGARSSRVVGQTIVKIRFQADENLNQVIVYGALRREPSVDFQTPQEAGLHFNLV